MNNGFAPGTHVLEASAGTGKTYRLSRYVLSLVLQTPDLRMEQVLVVTFTVAATGELKERIRVLLQDAHDVVEAHQLGLPPPAVSITFEELTELAPNSATESGQWRDRLVRAIRDFDQLTVSTIHGLCHRILGQYALLVGSSLGAELRQDVQRELRQAVNDTLVDYERRMDPNWARWGLDDVLSGVLNEREYPIGWYLRTNLVAPPSLLDRSVEDRVSELERVRLQFIREVRGNGEAFGARTRSLRPVLAKGQKAGEVFGSQKSANLVYGVAFEGASADEALLIALAEMLQTSPRVSIHRWRALGAADRKRYGVPTLQELAADSFWLTDAQKFAATKLPKSPLPQVEFLTRASVEASMTTVPMDALRAFLVESPIPQLVGQLCDLHRSLHLATRALFVRDARQRLDHQLRALDVISHDDTIRMVAQAVRGERGPELLTALGKRYRYGFIDEFQDTDGAQWALFHDLFAARADLASPASLYLVGDPKQAIYSFRGADVQTFQEAVRGIPSLPLDTNHRSAVEHVEAVNILFHHRVALGALPAEAIRVVDAAQEALLPATHFAEGAQPTAWLPVLTSPLTHEALQLEHKPVRAAKWAHPGAGTLAPGIEVRLVAGSLLVEGEDEEADAEKAGDPEEPSGIPWDKPASGAGFNTGTLAAIARDIAERLVEGPRLPKLVAASALGDRDVDAPKRLRPQDIAVLGRSRRQLSEIWRQLLALGVPATLWQETKVVESAAWEWIDALLALLETPDGARARLRVAATPLTGWGAEALMELQDPTSASTAMFASWAQRWVNHVARRGVISGFRALLDGTGVDGMPSSATPRMSPAERVLGRAAGERELADWVQLVELIDQLYRIERRSWTTIRRALRQARSEEDDNPHQVAARALLPPVASDARMVARLERETPGVRLMTMHKAKGLQFPVVYVLGLDGAPHDPEFLSEPPQPGHEHAGRRYTPVLWNAATWPDTAEDRAWAGVDGTWLEREMGRARAMDADEAMRLAYVGLTRAEVRTYWYAPLNGRGAGTADQRILGGNLLDDALGSDEALRTAEQLDDDGFPKGMWATWTSSSKDKPSIREQAQRVVRTLRARAASLGRAQTTQGAPLTVRVLEPLAADEGDLPVRVAAAMNAMEESEVSELVVRPFPRGPFPARWRAWSFSGIKAAAYQDIHPTQAGFAQPTTDDTPGLAEAEGGASDETIDTVTESADSSLANAAEDAFGDGEGLSVDAFASAPGITALPVGRLPLAPFPGGKRAGTALHGVFEDYDFQRADAEADMAPEPMPLAGAGGTGKDRPLAQVVVDRLYEAGFRDPADIRTAYVGVRDALRTPMGGVVGGLRLADIPREHRLDELRFNLALVGGNAATRNQFVSGDAFREVYLSRPTDGIFDASYKQQVRENRAGQEGLAGYLNGSIDLVFAAPVGGVRQFFVVDYKSNRVVREREGQLRDPEKPLTADDYAWDCLTRQMQTSDYILQASLYVVALHRYLNQRVVGYDYDRDMGGAYYLFFRGMAEPAPAGATRSSLAPGVFFDRPPRPWIEALSDLLSFGAVANLEAP